MATPPRAERRRPLSSLSRTFLEAVSRIHWIGRNDGSGLRCRHPKAVESPGAECDQPVKEIRDAGAELGPALALPAPTPAALPVRAGGQTRLGARLLSPRPGS